MQVVWTLDIITHIRKSKYTILDILAAMDRRQLIDVSHISSKGSSFRITLPRKIVQKLNLSPDDIIAFYEDDGIKIDKLQ